MLDDLEAARRALAYPGTDPTTLAHITQAFPQLGPTAAAHPNAYPELVTWVEQYSDALARQREQAALLEAAPPVAGSAVGDAPRPSTVPGSLASTDAPARTLTARDAPRRRLLVPVLAGVAALLLVTAGITTTAAVIQANRAPDATHSTADSADRAADPVAGSGSRSGSSTSGGSAATGSGGVSSSPGAGSTSGASEAPVAAKGGGQAPVVLILDASGSMVRETRPGRTRMDDARDALLKVVEDLPDDSQVALLVFGTGTGNSDAEQAAGCTDVKTVTPLGTLDRKALGGSIKAVKPSGYTPIGPALRTAARMLPEHAAGTIVLVSDGVDTCSPPPACEVASELHGANDALTIHAVGFGVDKDEQAKQQLDCIGKVGGGSYLPASSVDQLSSRITAAVKGTDTAKTISADGFHDVRLGMTEDEVRARSGSYKVTGKKTVDGVEIVYVDCGWGTVEFRGGLVYAIRPAADTPTLDGLAVGGAVDRAVEIYGAPVAKGKDDLGSYEVYAVSTGSPYGYAVYGSGTIKRIVLCRCTGISTAASLADWDITFAGVGPLRLGMTTKEMLAALPGSVAADDSAPSGAVQTGTGQPLPTMQPLPGVPDLRVRWFQGRIVSILLGTDQDWSAGSDDLSAAGAKLPNLRGIRLGDTGATVRNIIPQGTNFRILAAGISNYTIATRGGATLTMVGAGAPLQNPDGPDSSLVRGFELTDSTKVQYPWGDPVSSASPIPAPVTPAPKSGVSITSDYAKQLLIPAGSCGSGKDVGWNQSLPIQLQDGSGEAFPPGDGSGGASILGARLVGGVDLTGDGVDDAVLVIQCSGTPKAQCCAGRASILDAVIALDVSGPEPKRIGDPIFGGSFATASGAQGLFINDEQDPVQLDGHDIITHEVPIYDDEMSPADVAAATGWFRHTLSNGQWTRRAK
ncbi:VWA domain-containing protein [Microbacterium xylanilyticum]